MGVGCSSLSLLGSMAAPVGNIERGRKIEASAERVVKARLCLREESNGAAANSLPDPSARGGPRQAECRCGG